MASKSNYLENKVLDAVCGNQAFPANATVYLALFTVTPSDSGGGTEVTGGSYSRVAITNNLVNWNTASLGLKDNAVDFTFPQATANWGTVVAWALFDAASAGNMLYWGGLISAPKPFVVHDPTTEDRVGCAAHGFTNNDQVVPYVIQTAALPPELVSGTAYFVINATTHDFQLSTSQGGSAINFSNAGAGMIAKLTSRVVNSGDTPKFLIGQLLIREE